MAEVLLALSEEDYLSEVKGSAQDRLVTWPSLLLSYNLQQLA